MVDGRRRRRKKDGFGRGVIRRHTEKLTKNENAENDELRSERAREASREDYELGEASLEQGDDGGVLVVLGVIEGSGAIMSSEAGISTRQQERSDGRRVAFLRGEEKSCGAILWSGIVHTSASSRQSVNDQSVAVLGSDHQRRISLLVGHDLVRVSASSDEAVHSLQLTKLRGEV